MGRRAKSGTAAERVVQKRLKDKERRRTQSQDKLATRRRTLYWKKHGQQGSSRALYLPARLITEALQDLPERTHLFQQALSSPDNLDETGLDIWDTGPPYPTGPPSNSAREMEFTARLVEVMHGRRLRILRETIERGDINSNTVQDIIGKWRIGEKFLPDYHDGHREEIMARLWKEWLARMAYYYAQHLNIVV